MVLIVINESQGGGSRCLQHAVMRGKTHQTQYQFYSTPSTEKCCVLPVPFYNNTSIIITAATTEREKESNKKTKKRRMKKQRDVKDKHSIRLNKKKKNRQDVRANQKRKSRERDREWKRDETFTLKQSSMMKSEHKTWHQTIKRNRMGERWDKGRHTSLH